MTQIDFQPLDQQPQQQIDFQPIDQSPPQQSIWDATKAALSSRPELQPYGMGQSQQQPTSVVGSALQAAGNTLAAPIRTGATLGQAPDVTGQTIVEGTGQSNNPYIRGAGVAVGGAVQMAPYIAGGVGLYQGANAIEQPIVKGLMNTPQELGPEYHALDEQAGVGPNLPVQRGTVAKFPGLDGTPQNQPPTQAPNVAPTVYPKDTNTYLNFVRSRIDSLGKNLTPQELSDHDTILNDIMTKMKAQGQRGTKVFAKAADAGSDITDLRNANVPGRPALNQAYGVSKNQQAITDALKHYGGKAAQWGGPIAGGLAAAYDYFKK